MMNRRYQILLTNDDGIASPGLWAAAEVLADLGHVNVVAPREQSSGAGRSLSQTADGIIHPQPMRVRDQDWTVYAVGGTPAQAVLHAVLEILPERPDLVVSGINYGGNLGSGVTISGTIGAALEAASLGISALAVSLETEDHDHLSHSDQVDFSGAAHFTHLFAQMLLRRQMPPDVDVLKVDLPSDAGPETPWTVTRLAKLRYYESVAPDRDSWDEPARIGYRQAQQSEKPPEDSDVYAVSIRRMVSVTPLSLDLTSRIRLDELETYLRKVGRNETD